MKVKNWRMVMNLVDTVIDTPHYMTALQFETYWNTSGKYHWNSKTNGWIDWIHDKWNSGLINLEEYRFLINVNVE